MPSRHILPLPRHRGRHWPHVYLSARVEVRRPRGAESARPLLSPALLRARADGGRRGLELLARVQRAHEGAQAGPLGQPPLQRGPLLGAAQEDAAREAGVRDAPQRARVLHTVHVDVHRRRGRLRVHRQPLRLAQLLAEVARVVLQLGDDDGGGDDAVDGGDGGAGQEGRQRRGEAVAQAVEPLVVDDLLGAAAEAPDGAQRVAQARRDDVHAVRVDIEVLGSPAAGAPQHAHGEGVLHDEAVAVALLERHELRQRREVARLREDALRYDEAAVGHLLPPPPLVARRDLLEHALEVLHVVVAEGVHGGAREHDAVHERVAHGLVADHDVAALGEGRHHARRRGDVVRVQDGVLRADELRDALLQLQVHVDGAVEAARAARAAAVLVERVHAGVLDALVAREPQEVHRRQVDHLRPVHHRRRPALPGEDVLGQRLGHHVGRRQRLRLPLLAQHVHLLGRERRLVLVARLVALLDEQVHDSGQQYRLHEQMRGHAQQGQRARLRAGAVRLR
mmetsp:Transcript_5094/g.18579  ORF Transcript_5094/g.18579 Transcript_5094/m.18579 type:complete len:509 (-) Transcript_5094:307-1833(-)